MKYSINVGDTVFIEEELRTVSDILRNEKKEPIIAWFAKKNTEGVCIPALWNEWKLGIPQDKRREI